MAEQGFARIQERKRAQLEELMRQPVAGAAPQPTADSTPAPRGSSFTSAPRRDGESMLEYRKRMEAEGR